MNASADTVRPIVPDARRPRGIYIEPCEVPGKVWIVVHDSTEEEICRSRLSRRVMSRATRAYFEAWLDTEDPLPSAIRLMR